MASFNKIKEGQTLYDCKRANAFSGWKWDVWPVRVITLYPDERRALCSWNNNKPRLYNETQLKRLKIKEPK